jgi:hypothetical protein
MREDRAPGRIRTGIPVRGHQHLKLARLPFPPRAHGPGIGPSIPGSGSEVLITTTHGQGRPSSSPLKGSLPCRACDPFRTDDLLITSEMFCQLNYTGTIKSNLHDGVPSLVHFGSAASFTACIPTTTSVARWPPWIRTRRFRGQNPAGMPILLVAIMCQAEGGKHSRKRRKPSAWLV